MQSNFLTKAYTIQFLISKGISFLYSMSYRFNSLYQHICSQMFIPPIEQLKKYSQLNNIPSNYQLIQTRATRGHLAAPSTLRPSFQVLLLYQPSFARGGPNLSNNRNCDVILNYFSCAINRMYFCHLRAE